MGEGQTKRQIVGSLDMSRSLHQTKEIHRNMLPFVHHVYLAADFSSGHTFLTSVCVCGRLIVSAEQIF